MVRKVLTLSKADQLKFISEFDEIVLSVEEYSRISFVGEKDSILLLEKIKLAGKKVFLDFDIIMTENEFIHFINRFDIEYFNLFDAIRVQDTGVMEYFFRHTKLPIQINAQTANHNLTSLEIWQRYLGDRLERIILSYELDHHDLKRFSSILIKPLELMVVGPILLFYSPRKLVSALDGEIIEDEMIILAAKSEESPHKGFEVIENKHGTFMYHNKDFYLLDYLDELESLNLSYYRYDLRRLSNQLLLNKEEYPYPVMRGFYHVNKSDVLFSKLKNTELLEMKKNSWGQVLENKKSEYIVFESTEEMSVEKNILTQCFYPDGKIQEVNLHSFENTLGEKVDKINIGDIIKCKCSKNPPVKSVFMK